VTGLRRPPVLAGRPGVFFLAILALGLILGAGAGVAAPTPTPTTKRSPAAPTRARTPGPTRPLAAGAPGGPTDFSGLWELDPILSSGGASNMEGAVLEVSQKGDHIWIQPLGRARTSLLAEEVVADGRTYEKAIGEKDGRRGSLTARWGTDAQSLWLEVVAGTEEEPRAAVQRSVWKLSSDRSTWVRETITMTHGSARRSRLVFRRQDPKRLTPSPTP
jgi:hypothetical protein